MGTEHIMSRQGMARSRRAVESSYHPPRGILRRRSDPRRGGGRVAGDAAPPIVHEVLSSPGRPLEPSVREPMESRFGHDFSRVRIHTGSQADRSARAVGALAYTVGSDLVFADGGYAPGAPEGRELLAHELTHAVQQRDTAASSPGEVLIGSDHDAAEQEARRHARTVSASLGVPPTSQAGRTLQRKPEAGAENKRLQEYLSFVRSKRDDLAIEGRLDSDDMARAIVADPQIYATLTLRQKAVLVLEMLDGVTGDDDEDAILKILRDVQSQGRLQELLIWVPVQELHSDINWSQHDELEKILGQEDFEVSYEDCTEEDRRKLLKKTSEAQTWVERAIIVLDGMLSNPASTTSRNRAALEGNFHISSPEKDTDSVRKIREGYQKLQAGFTSGVPIECESKCGPGVRGYVYALTPLGLTLGWSDIHICPDFFELDERHQVTALIHEMAHKFLRATGEVYRILHSTAYSRLSTAEAINNADCYGWFARHIR